MGKHPKVVVFLVFCEIIVMLESKIDGARASDRKLRDYLKVSKPFFNPETNQIVKVNCIYFLKG